MNETVSQCESFKAPPNPSTDKMAEKDSETLCEKGRTAAKKVRKKRGAASLKGAMKEFLAMNVTDDVLTEVVKLACCEDAVNYRTAITAALVRKALDGDVRAYHEIRSLVGEDTDAERLKIQNRELELKEQKESPTDCGAVQEILEAFKDA